MKVKDKELRRDVDVSRPDCPKFKCYWPRPDPGVFTHGQGYMASESGDRGYLCGNREINGCPSSPKKKESAGMTGNDVKALGLVIDSGGVLETSPSGVGFCLYPQPKKGGSRGRWPQGMAMAGGKAMRRLEKMGLITIRPTDSYQTRYAVTAAGRAAYQQTAQKGGK